MLPRPPNLYASEKSAKSDAKTSQSAALLPSPFQNSFKASDSARRSRRRVINEISGKAGRSDGACANSLIISFLNYLIALSPRSLRNTGELKIITEIYTFFRCIYNIDTHNNFILTVSSRNCSLIPTQGLALSQHAKPLPLILRGERRLRKWPRFQNARAHFVLFSNCSPPRRECSN